MVIPSFPLRGSGTISSLRATLNIVEERNCPWNELWGFFVSLQEGTAEKQREKKVCQRCDSIAVRLDTLGIDLRVYPKRILSIQLVWV
jgi:hypothetical protein